MASAKKKTSRKKRGNKVSVQVPQLPVADIVAVFVGSIGIFLTLAFLSYHPTDPSASVAGDSRPASNWVGAVGAIFADALIAPFGLTAIGIPLFFLYLAANLLRRRSPLFPPLKLMATGSALFFGCLLLAHYPGQFVVEGGTIEAGGWIGRSLDLALLEHFNRLGTLVVSLCGFIISLQVLLAFEIGPKLSSATTSVGTFVVGTVAELSASLRSSLKSPEPDDLIQPNPLAGEEHLARPGVFQRWFAFFRPVPEDAPAAHTRPTKERPTRRTSAGTGRRTEGDEKLLTDLEELEPKSNKIRPRPVVSAGLPTDASHEVTSAPHDESDMEWDEEEPEEPPEEESELDGEQGVTPPRQRRANKAALPMGPRIVKSKYMEGSTTDSGGDEAWPIAANPRFQLPPLDFLSRPPVQEGAMSEEELIASARVLEAKLRDYGVEGEVVEIHPGPVITMYEYRPAPGVKVSKITNLSNDLAMVLKATAVRIVAPLPGKAAVGIEVPNRSRQTVFLREVVEHEEFRHDGFKLPMAIGKDIEGKPYAADMGKMPHLLVAGSTGAGKSVAVNAMLLSLLYARTPDEVRLILVDPKMIEFSLYNDIPHLLMPVVVDPKKASLALNWAVDEMSRRYQLLTIAGARNIANYNALVEQNLSKTPDPIEQEASMLRQKLPYVLIVIDELADLMMVVGKEVQDSIVRLAQMARAAGIHMILATQRPSVDVITGLIKANFPARIAFKVSSKIDSRTILDANGAEYLLGNGDMLFIAPGTASLIRLHGAFVSDEEVRHVVEHLRKQGLPRYEESLLASTSDDALGSEQEDDEPKDEFYEEAKAIVLETGQASISTIQRRLKIGYNRSARMVEQMEKDGLVGPPTQAGKPREIFVTKLQASLR